MLLINDLKRHHLEIKFELSKGIDAVLESGRYILGEQVEKFETEFSQFCNTTHCITVGSGSDALELALRALKIHANDTVITVANAGGYSTAAILAVGAIPHYVDINLETLLISAEHLRCALKEIKPKAAIVTHLYGKAVPADIFSILHTHDIPIIEDCAQAAGAKVDGKRVGALGALGCFSFYPSKNLGAIGDGGAIVTNNNELADRLFQLRQYGWKERYQVNFLGGRNSRLDELQASILRIKLKFLEKWNQKRIDIVEKYIQNIAHPEIYMPKVNRESDVGHLFVGCTKARDKLLSYLLQHEIQGSIHYPHPDYLQTGFSHFFKKIFLANTEKACGEIFTLPCFPEMYDNEIDYVIECVNNWK